LEYLLQTWERRKIFLDEILITMRGIVNNLSVSDKLKSKEIDTSNKTKGFVNQEEVYIDKVKAVKLIESLKNGDQVLKSSGDTVKNSQLQALASAMKIVNQKINPLYADTLKVASYIPLPSLITGIINIFEWYYNCYNIKNFHLYRSTPFKC